MRKELPNQESLFDSIPASDRLYGVGDRLYRLVLDSVRPIIVTEAFECRDCDDPLGGRTFRHHSNQEGGGNWTFGKGDVGVNVFESRADAEAQGARNIREMGVDVVPAASIAPSEWLALEENGASFGRARPLYACCVYSSIKKSTFRSAGFRHFAGKRRRTSHPSLPISRASAPRPSSCSGR